jgi:putative YhdH/YhfP family quinone oxidoreductase
MADVQQFDGYLVRRDADGKVAGRVESLDINQLPEGDVLIQVAWSSLNYKDALAAQGHPGVAPRLPHVPGIDAAGRVVQSSATEFSVGQTVLVTGYELGAGSWGGWSHYIRVPASWIVPLPQGLTLRDAMILGTAGFTAAQCAMRLRQHDVWPSSGPIVVTGATGGVGCLSVKLLARLGYQVTASTGKQDQADWLLGLGAAQVIGRQELLNPPDKPLAAARWAGAVDTVGGETLASIVRASQLQGCVTAAGLVAGAELQLTVYPFILRGVALAGVSSQNCPMPLRRELWRKLASDWRLDGLEALTREVDLNGLDQPLRDISAGHVRGRVLVRLQGDAPGHAGDRRGYRGDPS